MKCPHCESEAFPIKVACPKCDAELPAITQSLEAPEARASAPKSVCCIGCGEMTERPRLACPECNGTLPEPFSLVADDKELVAERIKSDPDDGYYILSSVDPCENCLELCDTKLSKAEVLKVLPPHPGCLHQLCWCHIIFYPPSGPCEFKSMNEQMAPSSEEVRVQLDRELSRAGLSRKPRNEEN